MFVEMAKNPDSIVSANFSRSGFGFGCALDRLSKVMGQCLRPPGGHLSDVINWPIDWAKTKCWQFQKCIEMFMRAFLWDIVGFSDISLSSGHRNIRPHEQHTAHVLIESIKIVACFCLNRSLKWREMSNNVIQQQQREKKREKKKNSRRFIRHCEKWRDKWPSN